MSDKSKNTQTAKSGKHDKQKPSDSKPHKTHTKGRDRQHGKDWKETHPNTFVKTPQQTILTDMRENKDEVLILDEDNPKKKSYARREIRSNWTEYELPLEDYDIAEEDNSQGANFEDLLRMPISKGGHFQFSHEKAWTSTKKTSQYSDLFTLDLKYISSALSCVPFLEKNRLDSSHFSEEQLTRMTTTAEKNLERFKKNLPIENPITNSLIKSLAKKEDEKVLKDDIKKSLSDDEMTIDDLQMDVVECLIKVNVEPQNVVKRSKVDVEEKKIEVVSNNDDDDDELNELLGLSLTPLPKLEISSAPKPTTIPSSISKPLDSTKPDAMDLDKWLDDYLDSDN